MRCIKTVAVAALGLGLLAGPAWAQESSEALIKKAIGLMEPRFEPALDRNCAVGLPLPVVLGKGAPTSPGKLFDNLYYVGRTDVGAWVLKTSDGLVLIDTLYSVADAENVVVGGMRKLGLDPAQLKLVILTHHHRDHSGGWTYFRDKGVRVMVSEPDWGPLGGAPDPQGILRDGQIVTVGDTKITIVYTPGHTPGTITAVFPVFENGRRHMAALLGGVGPRGGIPEHRSGVEGMERLMQVVKSQGVDVELQTHSIFEDPIALQ